MSDSEYESPQKHEDKPEDPSVEESPKKEDDDKRSNPSDDNRSNKSRSRSGSRASSTSRSPPRSDRSSNHNDEAPAEEAGEGNAEEEDRYSEDEQYQDEQNQEEQSPSKPHGSKARSGRGGNANAYPPVATVSYPAREKNLQVTDFLDPSRPLVKSTLPLTKPVGPTFVEEDKIVERIRRRNTHKQQKASESTKINRQRANERRYLKAQYEFEREKQLAERAIYHRERCSQWSQRLGASPLAVDLVADNERIEEEAYIRELEEKRRKSLAEKKKRRVKNQIIVKALAEVPLLEEARRQKREILDEERRERALRDVQRVEVIQMRKARDQALMEKERQERLDQRIMSQTSKQKQ